MEIFQLYELYECRGRYLKMRVTTYVHMLEVRGSPLKLGRNPVIYHKADPIWLHRDTYWERPNCFPDGGATWLMSPQMGCNCFASWGKYVKITGALFLSDEFSDTTHLSADNLQTCVGTHHHITQLFICTLSILLLELTELALIPRQATKWNSFDLFYFSSWNIQFWHQWLELGIGVKDNRMVPSGAGTRPPTHPLSLRRCVPWWVRR